MSLDRRKLLKAGVAAAGGVSGVAVAAQLAERFGLRPPDGGGIWGPGQTMTYAAHRLVARHSLAREFPRSAISSPPHANGRPPRDKVFTDLQAGGFKDWRLHVDGMVARPAAFSLSDLERFPLRGQITHLACEEGWSFIAEWVGVPLLHILKEVGIVPEARFVVARTIQRNWWDSLDMVDALHPQTILTLGMNGGDLPVGHGGPLRLRVPRQLGYKSLKYLTRLTVVDSVKGIGKGMGSSAAERGYAWYSGI